MLKIAAENGLWPEKISSKIEDCREMVCRTNSHGATIRQFGSWARFEMEHCSSQSAASSGMQRRVDLSANKQTEHKIDFVAGMVNDAQTLGGSRGWPERLLGGQRQP